MRHSTGQVVQYGMALTWMAA
ncbi:hypothetical protein A2U01_0104020, partial [Trifolium medium]|nr:hypothetical protein [Trifolium medium]